MLKAYKSNLLSSEKVTHGFYTRLGGASQGLYESLNLGLGSADLRENVLENRGLVCHDFGDKGFELLTLYQIHSAEVVTVDKAWDLSQLPKADAMVTNKPNLILGILTADCVPVLFADQKNGVIGASHAGWKGALGGVVKNTIKAMCNIGAEKQHIAAVVGPAIAAESYEVGDDVREAFINKGPKFEKFFIPNENHRFQFNLTGLVYSLIKQEKIESLEQIDQDTYKNTSEFYSFRRSTHKKEKDYGRQISAICLKV